MSTTCLRCRSNGFAIISALFLLVVLAALAGFIVSVSSIQALTFAQDIQGARAYQAARAGTEWGIYRWVNNNYTCTSSTPPHITFSDPDLNTFTTTVVAARFPILIPDQPTTGVLTTATSTIDPLQVSVPSADGQYIVPGMAAKGTGIADGTTVSSIADKITVTLSAPYTATSGPVTFGAVFCEITSTATPTGAAEGSLGFIERQLRVVVEN